MNNSVDESEVRFAIFFPLVEQGWEQCSHLSGKGKDYIKLELLTKA